MQVRGEHSNSSNKKGWIRGVILVIAWFLIISLVKDLWQVKKGFVRIEESKQRLTEAETKNRELKEKLSLVSSEEDREKISREQVNMQKIGEVVAVLPKASTNKITETDIQGTETQNWKKWWSLLK